MYCQPQRANRQAQAQAQAQAQQHQRTVLAGNKRGGFDWGWSWAPRGAPTATPAQVPHSHARTVHAVLCFCANMFSPPAQPTPSPHLSVSKIHALRVAILGAAALGLLGALQG